MDLPDLNVWLALGHHDHLHHARAEVYWAREAADQVAFCRATMLGLLRLLSNSHVMGGRPLTPAQAWNFFERLTALPEVVFLPEPVGAQARFEGLTKDPAFPSSRWSDAWLAACSISAGARLVSLDGDFRTFPGLSFLHLA